MFIPFVCGAAAWTADVTMVPRREAWGNPVSPPPPGGGVAEGLALEQGGGETGFPHLPTP